MAYHKTFSAIALLAGAMALSAAPLAQQDHDHHDHEGAEDHGETHDHGELDHDAMNHEGHEEAAEEHDHEDHDDHDDHDHHDHHMPDVTDGPWSYMGREWPDPFQQDRWEVLQVPGHPHTFIAADAVEPHFHCKVLLDSPGMMVDRATQAACEELMEESPFAGRIGRDALEAAAAAPGYTGTLEPGDGVSGGALDRHRGGQPLGEDFVPYPGEVARDPHEHHEHHDHDHDHHDHNDHDDHDHHDHHDHDHGWEAPQAWHERGNPLAANEESLRTGGAIFESNCAVCHGPGGQGDGPAAGSLDTPPTDLAAHGEHHGAGEYAWIIREGHGEMPGFADTLSEDEIWHVVNYIQVELADNDADAEHGAHEHHDH